MEEIAETHGLEMQTAIMHVLYGRNRNISFSEMTLDLENPAILKYVKRYVNRCRNDLRMCEGTFNEGSHFSREMKRYFRRECSFAEFTAEAAKDLARCFTEEEARSFVILFVDYRLDDMPFILAVLLEEQEANTAVSETVGSRIRNTISFGHGTLPPISRPVSSFAVVELLSGSVRFADTGKWKNGRSVIAERLLDAVSGMSRREAVNTVTGIACEVAEEFDENPTVVLARVKRYIADAAAEEVPLAAEQLVKDVFDEKPEMACSFLKKAEEKTLPKEVDLPKSSVRMSLRKQKLTTDTGIEITVPAEYLQNNEFVEFLKNEDGTTTIEIRKIARITNKL